MEIFCCSNKHKQILYTLLSSEHGIARDRRYYQPFKWTTILNFNLTETYPLLLHSIIPEPEELVSIVYCYRACEYTKEDQPIITSFFI